MKINFSGVVIAALGALLLAKNLGYVTFNWDLIVPVAIILWGIKIAFFRGK